MGAGLKFWVFEAFVRPAGSKKASCGQKSQGSAMRFSSAEGKSNRGGFDFASREALFERRGIGFSSAG
jgi:hypothetical protein